MSIYICFIYLDAPVLGAYIFTNILLSLGLTTLLLFDVPFLYFVNSLCFKYIFPNMSFAEAFCFFPFA